MRILNLLETNQVIEGLVKSLDVKLSEAQRIKVVDWSGGLNIWIEPLVRLVVKRQIINKEEAMNFLVEQGLFNVLWKEISDEDKLNILNPQLVASDDWLVTNGLIKGGRCFSPLFNFWVKEQAGEQKLVEDGEILTRNQTQALQLLRLKENQVCTRDEIAQAIWGKNWLDKYSDWALDSMIYHLRKKLGGGYSLVTMRNRGYCLKKSGERVENSIQVKAVKKAEGVSPTEKYFIYMNNKRNVRKVIADMIQALKREHLDKRVTRWSSKKPINVLVINSFSSDNIDSVANWVAERENRKDEIYFTNFYEPALSHHREYAKKHGFDSVRIIYDDIRQSRLKSGVFDVVINDFRLNFNDDHRQNQKALAEMHRVMKTGGWLILSTVVDCRYEGKRYGANQEKAPLNIYKPWEFVGQEKLVRKCFTIPYYKKLIRDAGLKIETQFDTEEGKRWRYSADDPKRGLSYRRWLVRKVSEGRGWKPGAY